MDSDNKSSRILWLKQQIASLPSGSITTKRIGGKTYYYLRNTINKKRVEKYVSFSDINTLQTQIKKRKVLEVELKSLLEKKRPPIKGKSDDFIANVILGDSLRLFSVPVKKLKKRGCYKLLKDFIYGEEQDKVLILYGLRRTGKTTLIRQILCEMSDVELSKSAFIQIMHQNTLSDINHDLKKLEEKGYRYIFLDEVTLLDDFIQGAALLSDVFASCGMKIVLSGTDSLGFLFAEDEQLYDRSIFIHTTFIPYREFENVLSIKGIDEYIRYGGTMSLGGVNYNENSIFANIEKADEYVDSAIARNIQHSLRSYQYEGHFRNLQELYENNELTSAINRVVEDINHRFTLDVLTRDFKSHDIAISASNLRRDREARTDILDNIDLPSVTAHLKELLEIRNKSEQKVSINDEALLEIEEYLHLLDLVQYVNVVSLSNLNKKAVRTIISQPGLRYAQADAVINSLLQDETFSALSLKERNAVSSRIQSEIMGRMMEDIVLFETTQANPKMDVFVLQFPIGEFDMVVFDKERGNCLIYDIKHSDKVVKEQYKHLVDEEKCKQTEHRYGPIISKTVLFRGKSQVYDGINYINVEEYLLSLSDLQE